jgi:2-hydroxyacyl-CoA lyase 1
LIIIGKGAAYADASEEVRKLVNQTKLPFLSSPMGKGVGDEDSEMNVGGARSTALLNADVILVLGARLN